MDFDAILDKPVFSAMPPEQRTAFKELVGKLNNKTLTEAMPIMLQFMADAPKGPPLPAETQDAMTEAVLESLNESDRAKFKMMMAFAKKRGG
ncbi:MAG: hypothetical protein FWE68_06500 [Defluviitaleaceae bacterium]|nr:hypothetical protein [Defluviitaleaceae bacterium]